MATKKKNIKNDKKISENLEVPEKCIIFAPVFITHYSYKPVFESVNNDKNPNLVANEAVSIRELLVRSSRGQRLNVKERMRAEGIPDDMYPDSELPKVNETIYDAPPDGIDDIVDVMDYQEDIKRRKAQREQRNKQSQTVANAPKSGTQKEGNGVKQDKPVTDQNAAERSEEE